MQNIASLDTVNTALSILTLSYSSEGSPALAVPDILITKNFLQPTIPGYPYNLLPVSSSDTGFIQKGIGQVLAWKAGLKLS
jgi:hypothetical protein